MKEEKQGNQQRDESESDDEGKPSRPKPTAPCRRIPPKTGEEKKQ